MRDTKPIATSWFVGLLLLALAACSMSSETAAPPAATAGSQQGGYLGLNPGAAAAQAPLMMPSTSMGWCGHSLDPGRCRSRAAADHDWCLAHNPDNYEGCRHMMDSVGWHN